MKFLNHIDLAGVSKLLNIPAPVADGDVVTKSFVMNEITKAIAGFDFQADVKAVQLDGTLIASTPKKGDRYIVTNIATLDSSFGTITGLANNDIIEFDGTKFIVSYDVVAKGDGILVFSQAEESYFKFVSGAWSYGGLTVIKAGSALSDVNGTFSVKFNNTNIGLNASGQLEVIDDSITKDKINANIAGQGLLQDTDGSLKLKLNDSRLTVDVDGLKLTETYTKKVSVNVGDSVATQVNVNHGLGTRDVMVQVIDNTSFDTVDATVSRPDLNSVTVQFATAPSSNQYRVVIIG